MEAKEQISDAIDCAMESAEEEIENAEKVIKELTRRLEIAKAAWNQAEKKMDCPSGFLHVDEVTTILDQCTPDFFKDEENEE